MTTYYVDTSALIKRYLTESGSEWVREIANPKAGNVIIVCDLTPVEFHSTLAPRWREGEITGENTQILQNRFMADLEIEYLSVPLESNVLTIARNLFAYTPYLLRSLDAIQLASAESAQVALGEPMTFVSADKRLLAAAGFHSFETDNPNDHL